MNFKIRWICTQLSYGLPLNALEIRFWWPGEVSTALFESVLLLLKTCLGNDKIELVVTSQNTQLY